MEKIGFSTSSRDLRGVIVAIAVGLVEGEAGKIEVLMIEKLLFFKLSLKGGWEFSFSFSVDVTVVVSAAELAVGIATAVSLAVSASLAFFYIGWMDTLRTRMCRLLAHPIGRSCSVGSSISRRSLSFLS